MLHCFSLKQAQHVDTACFTSHACCARRAVRAPSCPQRTVLLLLEADDDLIVEDPDLVRREDAALRTSA